MEKSKVIMNIIIGIMSLILVYVMFIQFRIVNENDVEEITFMRETELRETLATYKTNYNEAQEELEDVQGKINEYNQNEKSQEEKVQLLEEEVKMANMRLGLTDVVGDGITIKMEDNERGIEYSDLLKLINELIYAGAEAISINDERIIVASDIVNPTGPLILINGERKTSPFTIKAIGDITRLQSSLSIKGGYIDRYDDELSINVETGNVQINKYDKKITLNYANK